MVFLFWFAIQQLIQNYWITLAWNLWDRVFSQGDFFPNMPDMHGTCDVDSRFLKTMIVIAMDLFEDTNWL